MLADLLEAARSISPSRVVFNNDQSEVSLEDFHQHARTAARAVGGFDALVLLAVNGPILPTAIFAAAIAGVPVVPLNYRLTDDALRSLVERFDNPFVVVDSQQIGRIRHDAVTEEWSLQIAGGEEPSVESTVDDSAEADPIIAILYTSGTTSQPKAVPLRDVSLGSYILNTIDIASAGEDEAALISVPPYHVAGVASAVSNILSGRRLVYLPNFTAADWISTVTAEGITSAMVVPTMLSRIVQELDGVKGALPSLKQLSYGGARMNQSLLRRAMTALPDTGFTNAYGLTETNSTLALLSPDDHREAFASSDPLVTKRLESVGRPVPGVEFQVRDESGREIHDGSVGELWVRGTQVAGEYLDSGSMLDDAGWFYTRDHGSVDREGYVFIRGRADDTIIRGGENIAPAEIEDVLTNHPDVIDVAITGMPDPEWGECVVAAVVRNPLGPSGEELIEWCRERLRSSRSPDRVFFVDELPYNATGKLVRRELVEYLSTLSPWAS